MLSQKVSKKKGKEVGEVEDKLRQYAYLDELTGLPNRRFLLEILQELSEKKTAKKKQSFAILQLEIYQFKMIKYSLGPKFAERLLRAIAQRLNSHLPPGGVLTRIARDEFAILLKKITDLDSVIEFIEKIQDYFSYPLNLGENDIFVTLKIGLVLNDNCQGNSPEELLQAADIAMHQAISSDNYNYAVFEPIMQAKSIYRLKLDSDMRRALARQELQLYYQPIISLSNQNLQGFEALIRWRHSEKFVSPAEFIPIAEETGFIVELGKWILHQACWQLYQWNLEFPDHSPLSIAVNLSPIQLIQPNIVQLVDDILQETRLPAEQLKLEVTETAVMKNGEKVRQTLEELKAKKIKLCIDDFGTGYSSLSYLHNLPFHTLKIDQAFVNGLDKHSQGMDLVKIIAWLAHSLGMNIIAEGIETKEQMAKLRSLACEQGQGYLFSKPLSSVDAAKFIEAELDKKTIKIA